MLQMLVIRYKGQTIKKTKMIFYRQNLTDTQLLDLYRKILKPRLIEEKMLILLNFSASNAQTDPSINLVNAKVLLCNYRNAPAISKGKTSVTLKPYEAVIFKL